MPTLPSDSFTRAATGSAVADSPALNAKLVLNPFGHAGLRQQRLAFSGSVFSGHRLREFAVRRRGGPVRAVQAAPAAEQRGLEHVLIRQRGGDRLAHLHIVERRHLRVHRDVREAVGLRHRNDLGLGRLLHRRDVAGGEIDRQIGVAASRSGWPASPAPGTVCRMMRRKYGSLPSAPPFHASLRRSDDAFAGLEALDDVGAARRGVGLQPFQRPRIVRGRVLLRQLAVDHDGVGHAEIGQRRDGPASAASSRRCARRRCGTGPGWSSSRWTSAAAPGTSPRPRDPATTSTSSAVTGEPSCQVASGRSGMVIFRPSGLIS